MNRTLAVVLLALPLLACSSEVESTLLKLRYQPPRGVSLVGQEAGPPVVARFSSGLEIRAVEGEVLAVEEGGAGTLLPQVLAAAGLSSPGRLISAKEGTIPLGKVARYTFEAGEERSLLYYVPGATGFWVVKLTGSGSRYGQLEMQVERSLASLRAL